MRSGYKGCVCWRQREVQSGVEHLLAHTHHLLAAASQHDPTGLVRDMACVCVHLQKSLYLNELTDAFCLNSCEKCLNLFPLSFSLQGDAAALQIQEQSSCVSLQTTTKQSHLICIDLGSICDVFIISPKLKTSLVSHLKKYYLVKVIMIFSSW